MTCMGRMRDVPHGAKFTQWNFGTPAHVSSVLAFQGNPLCLPPAYRRHTIKILPELVELDGLPTKSPTTPAPEPFEDTPAVTAAPVAVGAGAGSKGLPSKPGSASGTAVSKPATIAAAAKPEAAPKASSKPGTPSVPMSTAAAANTAASSNSPEVGVKGKNPGTKASMPSVNTAPASQPGTACQEASIAPVAPEQPPGRLDCFRLLLRVFDLKPLPGWTGSTSGNASLPGMPGLPCAESGLPGKSPAPASALGAGSKLAGQASKVNGGAALQVELILFAKTLLLWPRCMHSASAMVMRCKRRHALRCTTDSSAISSVAKLIQHPDKLVCLHSRSQLRQAQSQQVPSLQHLHLLQ